MTAEAKVLAYPENNKAMCTILQGDALAELSRLPDASVDAVVTDPPYSSGGMMRGDRAGASTQAKYIGNACGKIRPNFSGDNRDQRGFGYWCTLWLAQCMRVTKPGGVLVVFTDWRQLPVLTDVIQAGGWVWRGVVPWDKTEGARPQKGRYRNQCEYVVWGSVGPMQDAGPCLPGYFRFPVVSKYKHHITGKPVELMRELLRIVPVGGTVLDPFTGSGSTAVAALQLGLSFHGFEINAEYCAIAKARVRDEVGLLLDQPLRGLRGGIVPAELPWEPRNHFH